MREVINTVLAAIVLFAVTAIPVSAKQFNPAVVEAVKDFTSNIPTTHWYQMKPEALLQKLNQGERVFLIDCRRPDEFGACHIKGALNLPLHQITDNLRQLPVDPNALIVAYCRSGTRSMFAISALLVLGYKNVFSLSGGFMAWLDAGYPVAE